MAGGHVFNVCILFCTLFFSLFEPSTSYLDYNLENSKVCSLVKRQELHMHEKENSAISLKELRYFDKWSGQYPFNCNFTVIAPRGYGIIAVIQNLALRKDESSQECIDYVQFQIRKTKLGITTGITQSQKFCGNVNSIREPEESDELEDTMPSVVAHNAFIVDNRNLDVTISVANQQLMSSEKLDISIIFTAYKQCQYGGSNGFKECSIGSGICIWEGFFGDKNVNCPYNDCFDEGHCPEISPGGKRPRSGLGTTVTIGAVVVILGLLLLFMFCLFICRRCQVLCWRQCTMEQPAGVVGTPMFNVGVSGEQNQPTAPPLLPVSSAASPVHEDKDLPPPYESLFPST